MQSSARDVFTKPPMMGWVCSATNGPPRLSLSFAFVQKGAEKNTMYNHHSRLAKNHVLPHEATRSDDLGGLTQTTGWITSPRRTHTARGGGDSMGPEEKTHTGRPTTGTTTRRWVKT